MVSGRGSRRLGKKKRWAFWLVLGLVALGVGAVAAPRLWMLRSGKEPERLDLLLAAWNEFNANRFDQASALLDRRAAAAQPTPLDWMLRARIAESQGRLVDALSFLKHIPDSDPVGSQAWLKAGQVELARHNARGAESAFLRSLKLNPDQIQAYRELAYLYAVQRRRDDCDAQFRALAERMPINYVLAFAWCQNYLGIWDPNEGSRTLSRFVAFDPDDRWSRLALATNYRLANLLDQAESVLGPLPDSDADARALRAQLAMDAGEIETATTLLHGGPTDHARLNVLRGKLALSGGEIRKAANDFRSALRRDPDDHDAIQGLGLALTRLGDPKARDYLELSLRYDEFKRAIQGSVDTLETDPKLFFKLGEHCESIHRIAEARAWFQIAIGRDPLDTQAHQALVRLDQAPPTPPTTPVRAMRRRTGPE
jgi:tetratricopeptide (TPR) repeat protein